MLCLATQLRARLPKMYLSFVSTLSRTYRSWKNLHRNRYHCASNCDASNRKEAITDTLNRNPVVDVERHAEGKHVLHKVHGRKRLSGLLTMAVHNISDHTGGAELHAQVDETHADDDWDGPGFLRVGGLAPAKL
jgi:hypothetical protein